MWVGIFRKVHLRSVVHHARCALLAKSLARVSLVQSLDAIGDMIGFLTVVFFTPVFVTSGA